MSQNGINSSYKRERILMKKLRENSIIFYILVNIALIRSLLNYNKSVYF